MRKGGADSKTVSRLLALTAAMAALAGAGLWILRHLRSTEVARTAAATTAVVNGGLRALGDQLAERAGRVGEIRALRAALNHGLDGVTLGDLLVTEDWWAPHREGLTLVMKGGERLVSHPAEARSLDDPALIARARVGQLALGWVGPIAAAALLVRGGPGEPYVIVLGQPLDAAALTSLAASNGLALMMSDGRSPGVFVGPAKWRAILADGVGHEGEGQRLDPAGRAVAVAVPVTAGRWIWAAHELPFGLLPPAWLPVSLLLLAALAAAMVLRRRRRQEPLVHAGSREPLPEEPAPGRATADQPTRIAHGNVQLFGRYALIQRLGEGGMSELFTAVLAGAEGFNRLYVLKRLKPEFSEVREAVDQFIDEAKLGSLLVHSNIVPVFDFGKVGNGYYLAQEYIAGRNLAEFCERHRERLETSLSVPLTSYIAYEVLEALAYAHERANDQGDPLHIVHRDVSLGNIMVTGQGEVKLLDFGIVRAAGRVSSTEIGHVKGNATFMAPEQARGQPVDGRADLFSLGMVMYHLLTGESLYNAPTSAEAFYQATTGLTAHHLARLRSALPGPFSEILEKVLAINPDNRYRNAREFADELAPYVAGAKSEAATLMSSLFGEDLRRQTASFRAKIGSTLPNAAKSG